MVQEKQIPCAKCRLWKPKQRKFSCKPNDCKELSAWLLRYASQLKPEPAETRGQFTENSIQYVV